MVDARVGQHRLPARCVDQLDGVLHLQAEAARHPYGVLGVGSQVLLEHVIDGGEPGRIVLDGDLRDVGTAGHSVAGQIHHVLLRHVQSIVVEALHLADLLLDAALDHLLQRLLQRRIVRVDAVSQDVDVQEVPILLFGRAQLDGREDVHARLRTRSAGLGHTPNAVVVGHGEHADAGGRRLGDQLLRGVRAVGEFRVGLKVDRVGAIHERSSSQMGK